LLADEGETERQQGEESAKVPLTRLIELNLKLAPGRPMAANVSARP
jgi:hypothetical protein